MNPPLSFEECAEFYAEMLSDVLTASARFAARLELEAVVAFHPRDGAGEILALAPPGFRLQLQQGEDLGERMAYAASEAAAAGAKLVLIRGSDSPGIPFECFEEALARLDRGDDVVLTPDQGGGYALVGLKQMDRRLFELPMSTARVLAQTLESAATLGWVASTTRPSFDLDTVGDLQLLEALSDEDKSDLCPRSVQYVMTLTASRVL